ncbi:YaaA family protein [Streptomyces halobius]|uniref:Peroxide stress protein YaaA n=1 Tax=Streptomyces halobius TaxID=2879846 RepID=A0ABY4MHB8_9ACTN|nr:peroxide stress protein YaaA [Streptomyces halobius]UQA95800.1 peroxide stress protein YaaA [Streptomyces halobius]
MLVLLPPSEGKAAGEAGAPLDADSLSLPGLAAARAAVLEELVELCAADETKAQEVLGLSDGLKGEIAKNAGLRTAGTRPAGEIYTGVLYDALGLASLDAAARRLAEESLLVFSGLWGAVRIGDRIPSYRCSMGVKLPGLGALGAYWRKPMAEVMPETAASGEVARWGSPRTKSGGASGRGGGRATGGLVLDLRSAAYATAWKPEGEVAGRTATVRVLQSKIVDGVEKRSVVSHFNKATKGRLVRDLLTAGLSPAGPAELVEALRGLGYVVEAQAPAKAGKAWALDVIVTEL